MIYVLSGGQTGATLTVTSSGAGTITVSNTSLGKSYSKSVTAGGSAVFKGLQTGTWTIKLTNGTQTSTKNITITSDYSTNIAYFSATISITYPAKSTCVVKNSSGQTVASDTNTGTSAKTWIATVNAKGTYTITATATDGSGKTKSATVSITTDGQVKTAELAYDYIIFSNETGLNSVYSDGGGGAVVKVSTNSSGTKILTFPSGGGYNRMAYLKPSIDLTKYSTLKISGYAGANRRFCVWSQTPNSNNNGIVASATMSAGSAPSSYTIDISKLSGNHYLGTEYAVSDTTIYDLRLE